MKYRSVLVEDEERPRSQLRRVLGGFADDVDIVGEALDGPTAVATIRALTPDLVFLDIDLPGFDGFRVLQAIEARPAVIFTTAFDRHALQAFRTHAVDYLLKPIDGGDVRRALDKLHATAFNQDRLLRALDQIVEAAGSRYLSRVLCKIGARTVLVKSTEIVYCQSDNKYTALHTATQEFLIDTPLVELEANLNPKDFVRIHRGTLVNVSCIVEIRRSGDGKQTVVLNDPRRTELPGSRMYADNLKSL